MAETLGFDDITWGLSSTKVKAENCTLGKVCGWSLLSFFFFFNAERIESKEKVWRCRRKQMMTFWASGNSKEASVAAAE